MSDSLQNYEILELIGQGETSTVHLAVCKRGRLRDRKVALKKIPRQTSQLSLSAAAHFSSSSIHQAFHHPSIVSLLSTFLSKSAHYHVMELCSRGTLSAFLHSRNDPILSESELRGLVRSLVDALIYLKKELVLHRDINAAAILLTADYRVKLSDFRLAIRLPSMNATMSTFCGSPKYPSPYVDLFSLYYTREIIAHTPYSFPTDVWSLGCLMVTSLSGTLTSEVDIVSSIFEKVSQASYTLPLGVSPEARALISSLLQIKPENRISLDHILTHPFLDPRFPVHSLRPMAGVNKKSVAGGTDSTKDSKMSYYHPNACIPLSKNQRKSMQEIGDIRHLLREQVPISIQGPAGSTRRIVSDPLPRKGPLASELITLAERTGRSSPAPTSTLVTELNSVSSPLTSLTNYEESDTPQVKVKTPLAQYPLQPPDTNTVSPETRSLSGTRLKSWAPVIDRSEKENLVLFNKSHGKRCIKPTIPSETSLRSPVPIGTIRPVPFTTSPLTPQTHKMAHGQITVLLSKSLVVDLREGERRIGRKGDEVLVIDADGGRVEVYAAPHLSTPCCLAEPVLVYSIQELPSLYWKRYNDAGRVVEQIKRKTPKLVFYSEKGKCTLMSNTPHGEIEIVYPSCPSPLRQQKKHRKVESMGQESPSMRVRLCRQRQTVELARFVHMPGGGEWTKRVLGVIDRRTSIRSVDRHSLLEIEKAAMDDLGEFVRICEAAEKVDEGDALFEQTLRRDSVTPDPPDKTNGLTSGSRSISPLQGRRANCDWEARPQPDNERGEPCISSAAATDGLSAFHVAPRPKKLLPRPTAASGIEERSIILGQASSTDIDTATHQVVTTSGGQGRSLDQYSYQTPTTGVDARFIPSVGWCIRYESRVSQGGRYRIMFLDGVALDVDVDEEYVKFTDRLGDVTRHEIRDCISKRDVGERMKVFKEFVSMFDDDK